MIHLNNVSQKVGCFEELEQKASSYFEVSTCDNLCLALASCKKRWIFVSKSSDQMLMLLSSDLISNFDVFIFRFEVIPSLRLASFLHQISGSLGKQLQYSACDSGDILLILVHASVSVKNDSSRDDGTL